MTELERAEARRLEPGIVRELGQSFFLMALMTVTLSAFLGMGLLAAWLFA